MKIARFSLLKTPKAMNTGESKTLKLHLAYSFIEGIILGVLALNEFVFLKSMNGSNYLMGMLFQSSMVVFLFLIFFNEFINRTTNRGRLLRITGIVTRGPLVLMLLFPANAAQLTGEFYHMAFLSLFFIYYAGNPVIYPTINQLLKNNYTHTNFGRFYSLAQSVNKAVMMVVTLLYGLWLDVNPMAFRWIFPLISLLGISSLWLLAAMDQAPQTARPPTTTSFWKGVGKSALRMKTILTTNKPFRHFQIGMMFYGFSFMVSVTIINIFFREGLNLNYTSVAFYKNFYNIEAILLLPFFGRLIGKIDPRLFAAITFSALLGYIALLWVTEIRPYQTTLGNIHIYYFLMAAFLVYGFFAATMALLWNIGSAYFCKPEESGDYQSVHLFLTAVRALFAPLFGVWIYEMWGFSTTFAVAIASLAAAIAILLISWYRNR